MLFLREGGFFKGAAAADTRATAAPLTQPSQPAQLVALRSWGSALGEKIWEFFWELLGSWLGDPLAAVKPQAQLVLLDPRARFTQWWMP